MQNCRYPAHGSPARSRSNEPTSMNTGWAPFHCTLYERRVLEDQVFVERAANQLELQQRGVAQHRE